MIDREKYRKHKRKTLFVSLILLIFLLLSGCGQTSSSNSAAVQTAVRHANETNTQAETDLQAEADAQVQADDQAETTVNNVQAQSQTDAVIINSSDLSLSLETIPDYQGNPYIEMNGNVPDFSEDEKSSLASFEYYSDLDSLGRCGVAYANICKEIMPTEERGAIGQIKPSGWHTVKYNDLIDGNYLYNRCHLIGYQLAGENANEKNLITGTRYLNVVGMLPFENAVADYVEETNNHVLYRVTPIFEGNNLLASGLQLEAWSVEDSGAGICFNVYCYNVQPGITIDYATGESWVSSDEGSGQIAVQQNGTEDTKVDYILNKNTHKIHLPSCSSVDDMKDSNKESYIGSIEELIEEGYSPCQRCLPD